ncbi:uncharacterized protein EV422DRAFT_350581 [Fimicolochytrium jonesii]|uniref:uncharacterized protein n=1 Tax=Fimicolochytrium jonesii TaxID=1396493 RepID=UPI0022FEC4C9|nr:uncharacterized protein EV422DRAFT_350581 [Fimicolochytrium jonesii]KAI8823340.1 hypothetical protein EV422DRAFT_350581 [Fimicolochytrium jonesii]
MPAAEMSSPSSSKQPPRNTPIPTQSVPIPTPALPTLPLPIPRLATISPTSGTLPAIPLTKAGPTYPPYIPSSPPKPASTPKPIINLETPDTDPSHLLEDLFHTLSDRRGCLIIGAGVSVSLADGEENKKLVTWRGFLDRLALTVKEMLGLPDGWYEEVQEMLQNDPAKIPPPPPEKGKDAAAAAGTHPASPLGRPIERQFALRLDKAAEMIEHYVNTGHLGGSSDPFMRYHHLVFKILHKLRADRNAPLAHILHSLRAPIFTTNYDVLLEDATGRFTLSIDDLLKAQRTYRLKSEQHPLAQHELYVFHLHGIFYDDPERKFVLTSGEYAVTIDDFIMALKPVLVDVGSKVKTGGMAFHRSMIFIGTGGTLQDIHFTALFASLYEHNTYLESNNFERVMHYVLLTTHEATYLTDFTFEDSLGRLIHAHELLVPVVYGEDYGDLPGYLGKLVAMLEEEEKRETARRAQGYTAEPDAGDAGTTGVGGPPPVVVTPDRTAPTPTPAVPVTLTHALYSSSPPFSPSIPTTAYSASFPSASFPALTLSTAQRTNGAHTPPLPAKDKLFGSGKGTVESDVESDAGGGGAGQRRGGRRRGSLVGGQLGGADPGAGGSGPS